jgi:thiamine-monophosphate kinase
MTIIDDRKTLREVGERFIVREITSTLLPSDMLLDGFGHDAAFVDLSLADGEILVINTDRSGLNIAYQLGLAGAGCVGDLGVSHAISDVVAAGGMPRVVTVALLLPPDTEVGFVRDVMKGAESAATRYGAIVAGGDTKQNPKFAMVVTAIGSAPREKRLKRSTARKGDALVVTGYLGSMLLGTIAFRKKLALPSKVRRALEVALVNQNPPFDLGRAFADACVANACIDISDGLSGALFSVCSASSVGAVIDECKLPIDPDLLDLAKSIGLRAMQLTLAGGDWQYLYAVPMEKLAEAERIAGSIGSRVTVIGNVVEPHFIAARTSEGEYRHLKRIEHDSFIDGIKGVGHFENLTNPQQCFGDVIDDRVIEDALVP